MNVKEPAVHTHISDSCIAHHRVDGWNFTRDSDDVREKITTNIVCDTPYTMKQVWHLVMWHLVMNMMPKAC